MQGFQNTRAQSQKHNPIKGLELLFVVALGLLGFTGTASAQQVARPSPTPAATNTSPSADRAQKSGQTPAASLFNNGVRSPSDYGSLPVPAAGDQPTAPAHYFFADDLTRLPDVRHYRVVALSVAPESRKPRIVGPSLQMPKLGTAPRRSYLNIGNHASEADARQFILDFFQANRDFIDANFVIRKVSASPRMHRFDVELGPFVSPRHATVFCRAVVQRKDSQAPCSPSLNFQSANEKDGFTGQATLGLSMAMIQRVMASNSFQEFNNLLDATVDVAEGESLGRGDYLVMKVMRRGVFVARETGPTFLLPADAIPMPTPAPDSPPEAVAPASGGTPTPTGTGG